MNSSLRCKCTVVAFLTPTILLLVSCGNLDSIVPVVSDSTTEADTTLNEDGRPEGWVDETHSKNAVVDYDIVFPDDKVNRLDITISAENWQIMQEDMIELYGEPGARDNTTQLQDGTRPEQMDDSRLGSPQLETNLAACSALAAGDECSLDIGIDSMTGTCTLMGEQLVCVPEGMPQNQGAGVPGERPDVPADVDGIGTPDDMTAPPTDANPGGGDGMGGLASTDNPVYVPCQIDFEGSTWWHVGIRYKGQSSLMTTWQSGIGKLPLRLNFDKFEDDYPEIDNQRFYGFDELSLTSNWSDDSLLREKVAHDIFRAAGVPAPHTAFYRVYVDFGEGPIYFGLYTMTEIPDGPMLEAQFGDDSGNLYKPTSSWVVFAEEDFDKESNSDEADYTDVQSAIAALHADRSDVVSWRAALEETMNVDEFLHWLAINTVIQNWDTYGNMAQNYYLHADPTDESRLTWIPWDNNMALSDSAGGMGRTLPLSLDDVTEDWPLIRYLADDAVYWQTYVTYVADTVESAFAVAATQARYQAAHELIAPYVVGEEGEQEGYTFLSDSQQFYDALDELLDHVEQRNQAVREFLADN